MLACKSAEHVTECTKGQPTTLSALFEKPAFYKTQCPGEFKPLRSESVIHHSIRFLMIVMACMMTVQKCNDKKKAEG